MMSTLLAALIDGFVVSVPLAATVWLVLGVSRRWVNAATRYAVWSILLAVVVCLPFRYVPFRPSRHYVPIAVAHAALPAASVTQPLSVPSRSSRPMRADPRWFPVRVAPGSWSVWVMAAWAIAAFGMLLRLFVSYALLGKMKRQAADAPEAVAASARSALERLGVTRRVHVAVVNVAVSPMVAGPFRPTILLPVVMLESMDEAEIAQICLHEAAHLARRDDWALMAQRLIEVVFALHPLVRWIAAQINLEREIACDDLVISVTGSARPYASCLTRIAELAGAFSGSSAAAAVSDERSHLTRRVEMLLDKTRHAGARLLGARLAVLACGLALVTLLAGRTPGVLVLLAPQRTIVAPSAPPSLPAVAPQLAAQARPATRPAPATPAVAAQPAAQAVRIGVNVTDPMNHFVTGLDSDAFHVFENGVEQKIVDFAPQAEPVSIAIVWEQKGELSDLRHRLSELWVLPPKEPGPKIRIEPRFIGGSDGAGIFANVPGTHVLPIQLGENQSIVDGFESALDQLRGTPPEQAAVVLVVDPSSWPVDRIRAVTNAADMSVYVLGVVSRGSGRSSEATPPALISRRAAGLEQYPIVTADEVAASLNWIPPELRSEYFIGYFANGPAEAGKVEVRMTPPVGLPALTARVSSY
jgi:beta-lactamase regulating signal transducer with metallopeptidase domain